MKNSPKNNGQQLSPKEIREIQNRLLITGLTKRKKEEDAFLNSPYIPDKVKNDWLNQKMETRAIDDAAGSFGILRRRDEILRGIMVPPLEVKTKSNSMDAIMPKYIPYSYQNRPTLTKTKNKKKYG